MVFFTHEEDHNLCIARVKIGREVAVGDPLAGGIPFWARVLLIIFEIDQPGIIRTQKH